VTHRARILGSGRTSFSRASGRSVLSLALEATDKACSDAGIGPSQIQGACTFGINDTISARALLNILPLSDIRWFCDLDGGGNISLTSVMLAAQMVDQGELDFAIVFRALNGRSAGRLGGTGKSIVAKEDRQYSASVGLTTYGQVSAMFARRHMERYGTTSEQFGHVAVAARSYAVDNPAAMRREPMTIEQHQMSRMVADPYHLYDFCLESDSAHAVLIGPAGSSATPGREIDIRAAMHVAGPHPGSDSWGSLEYEEHTVNFGRHLGDRLFAKAEMTRGDIDLTYLYDCFTFSVISQLEGFGFVPDGEGGPFVASGAIDPGGSFPLNTHGGMLSEGYGHAFNGLHEAITQLRGEAEDRQIARAETALVSGGATTSGNALVLARS
jgi:acetyl-CoA acetyltransferase